MHICQEEKFFDQPFGKPSPADREAEIVPKTEPISSMGDQPNNPNLNVEENINDEEGNNNDENPNLVEVNAEDVPAANANMAQAGVQGGQLSSIAIFTGNKGLDYFFLHATSTTKGRKK